MRKTLPDEQVLEDAARALDLLQRETRGAPLAAAGLRIGGRYALLVAAREPRRVRAAVSYYGAGIDGGTISPLWTIDALAQVQDLRTPMLLFFVGDDPTVPPAEVEAIDARLRRAAASYEIVRYPGVKPGFLLPGRDTYRRGGLGRVGSHGALPGQRAGIGPRQDRVVLGVEVDADRV